MNHKILNKLEQFLFLASFLLIFIAQYLIFMVVPSERVMGPVQRIFYFHVGSAFACYCSIAVLFIASVAYLATRKKVLDILAEAAGEVGFVFCTIVLISGMIWAKAAWNTFFDWRDPRLASFLLLWLILFGFNVLRYYGDTEKIGAHSAVLGILSAFTVPLVVFSVKLLGDGLQLHPQVLEKGGLKHPSYWYTFGISVLGLVLLQFYLVVLRVKIGWVLNKNKEGSYGADA